MDRPMSVILAQYWESGMNEDPNVTITNPILVTRDERGSQYLVHYLEPGDSMLVTTCSTLGTRDERGSQCW